MDFNLMFYAVTSSGLILAALALLNYLDCLKWKKKYLESQLELIRIRREQKAKIIDLPSTRAVATATDSPFSSRITSSEAVYWKNRYEKSRDALAAAIDLIQMFTAKTKLAPKKDVST